MKSHPIAKERENIQMSNIEK